MSRSRRVVEGSRLHVVTAAIVFSCNCDIFVRRSVLRVQNKQATELQSKGDGLKTKTPTRMETRDTYYRTRTMIHGFSSQRRRAVLSIFSDVLFQARPDYHASSPKSSVSQPAWLDSQPAHFPIVTHR